MIEKVRQKTKAITIRETRWRRLKSAGTMGNAFDSVINRALDVMRASPSFHARTPARY